MVAIRELERAATDKHNSELFGKCHRLLAHVRRPSFLKLWELQVQLIGSVPMLQGMIATLGKGPWTEPRGAYQWSENAT